MLFFDCPEDVLFKRLVKRGETSGRADDNAESIQKRFVTYREQSYPVIEKYDAMGKVKRVDSSTGTPGEVFEEVKALFGAVPEKKAEPATNGGSADQLFGKLPGVDPDYDLIVEESLAKNEYPLAKIEAAKAAPHTCLAAQFCTPELWAQYQDKQSTGPAKWTLARAINSGVMYPHSFVGCHAGDRESYDDFKDFFYPVIEAYHKGFSMERGSDLKGTASERMDPSKIGVDLSSSAQAKIVSTRIRIARNLAMFPLNPGGTRASREAIAAMMQKVYDGLAPGSELAGDFFLHTTMSDSQRQALIDGHQLFRGKDRMQAASGYHEHWPHGRGVFHNPDKTFVNWVNEGDHVRIISMQNGGDVKAVFARLSAGAKAIEDGVRAATGVEGEVFMMHPKFGAVTCCPSNIGTGMRGSVHILVPKLIASIGFEAIDKLARERNCQARGSSGEHSAVVDRIDISNWRRIGYPEYELVQDMINCANFLAQLEDESA